MLSTASAVNTEQSRAQLEHASGNFPDPKKQAEEKTAVITPISATPVQSPTESLKQQVRAGKGIQRRLTATLTRAFNGKKQQHSPEISALVEKQQWKNDLEPLEFAIENIWSTEALKKHFNPAMPLAEFERMLKLAAETKSKIAPHRKPHHHALQNELCLIDSIKDHLSPDMTGDQFKHLFSMAQFAADLTILNLEVREHALTTTVALISFVKEMYSENMTAKRLATVTDLLLHLVAVTKTLSLPNQCAIKLLQDHSIVINDETDSEPEENMGSAN